MTRQQCVYWVAMGNVFPIVDHCQKSLKVTVLGAASTSHRVEKNFTHDHRYDHKIIFLSGKTTFITFSGEQILINWEK